MYVYIYIYIYIHVMYIPVIFIYIYKCRTKSPRNSKGLSPRNLTPESIGKFQQCFITKG